MQDISTVKYSPPEYTFIMEYERRLPSILGDCTAAGMTSSGARGSEGIVVVSLVASVTVVTGGSVAEVAVYDEESAFSSAQPVEILVSRVNAATNDNVLDGFTVCLLYII